MTDFRALCVELTDCLEKADWPLRHRYVFLQWIDIARAALADEPAVPEGREPASVTGQPSDQELLDIAASTIEPYECSGITTDEYEPETECAVEAYGSELIAFARAVLARWGNPAPQPQPPAEGEVAELVQHLHHAAEVDDWDGASPEWCQSMLRAADLLEQRHPAPVPVSERLPEPEDCDAEGRCWWLAPETAQKCAVWCFGPKYPPPSMFGATHWLPAHALPLPGQEVH